MKKTLLQRSTACIICWYLTTMVLFGQSIPSKWEIALESNVQWMEVNDWGILIVSANDGLYGINPENGNELWKISELQNMPHDGYRVIPESPVTIFEDGPLLVVVNGLTGQVILNSSKAGLGKVTYTEVVPEIKGLLVEYKNSDERGLVLFDLFNSELKWTSDFSDLKGTSELQPKPAADAEGNVLYGYGKNLLKLDGHTGKVLWKTEMNKDIKDLFFDPEKSLVIVVDGSVSNAFRSDNSDSQITTTVQGNTGKFSITALNIASGEVSWSHVYKSKYAGVAGGADDFVLFHAFSTNVIDFKTGVKKWKSEPKYVGGGRLENLIVDDEGILYAIESAVSQGKMYMYYVSANGEKRWKKAPYTSPGLYYFQKTGGRLLYISSSGANMVDLATGKELWTKDMYISSGGVPILFTYDDEERPILLVKGKIIRILSAEGDWKVLATDVILNGETPASFERVPGGYLITGDQQALMINDAGKKQYHAYYAPPEQSLGKALLLSLANVAAVSMAQGFASGAIGYGMLGEMGDNDSYRGKSDVYMELFTASASVSQLLVDAANRRFTTDIETPDYKLILTRKDRKIGLVKILLSSGEEQGFVATEDRTPEFVLDQVTDRLFFKSGANRITSYDM